MVLLACRHPDECLRLTMRDALRSEAETAEGVLDRKHLQEMIERFQGIAIVPFALAKDLLELVVDVVHISISGHYQARFRVVSMDTIGSDGGLVILQSGKSYYTLPHKPRACSESTTWYMALGELPSMESIERLPGTMRAEVKWDGKGYSITISSAAINRALGVMTMERIAAFQDHSYVSEKRTLFNTFGLRLESTTKGDFVIVTGSAESLMRFSALCVQRDYLFLADDDDYAGRSAVITLPLLDAIPTTVPISYSRPLQDWANVPAEVEVMVSEEQSEDISRVVGCSEDDLIAEKAKPS